MSNKVADQVELVSGGNVFKIGDTITPVFQIREEDNTIMDLTGATAHIILANEQTRVLEKDAIVENNQIKIPFTPEDKITGWGNMRLEIHITQDGKTRKFPSDGFQQIKITPSLRDLNFVGVPFVTVETFVERMDTFDTDLTDQSAKIDVLSKVKDEQTSKIASLSVYLSDFPRLATETTDNPRIKRCIDSVDPVIGGKVLITEGNYKVNGLIDIAGKNNLYIEFHESAFITKDGTTDLDTAFSFTNCNNLTVVNPYFDGALATANAFLFDACVNSSVRKAKVKNLDTKTLNVSSNGLWFVGCDNVEVDGFLITDINSTVSKVSSGVTVASSSRANNNIRFKNGVIKNVKSANDADGIKFLGHDVYVYSSVTDCYFYDCNKRAIKMQSNGISLKNITVSNTAPRTTRGNFLIDCQGVLDITADTINITMSSYNDGIGLTLGNLTGCENIHFKNVTINLTESSQTCYAIRSSGSIDLKDITLENVKIRKLNNAVFDKEIWFADIGTKTSRNIRVINAICSTLEVHGSVNGVILKDCIINYLNMYGDNTNLIYSKNIKVRECIITERALFNVVDSKIESNDFKSSYNGDIVNFSSTSLDTNTEFNFNTITGDIAQANSRGLRIGSLNLKAKGNKINNCVTGAYLNKESIVFTENEIKNCTNKITESTFIGSAQKYYNKGVNDSSASPPVNPQEGYMYMDNGTNRADTKAGIRRYINGAWADI